MVNQYVSNGSVQLHYEVFGQGQPVLLLSGGPGGSCHELWPLAQEVAKSHQAILLEQRGTGRSVLPFIDSATINVEAYVADVEAVRRDLNVERWIVLGHSAGGMIGLLAAATHPDRLAGLIGVETAGPDLSFVVEAPGRMRMTKEDQATFDKWSDPQAVAADPEQAAREMYRAFVAATSHDRSVAERVMEYFRFEPHTMTISKTVMKDLMERGFDIRDQLRNVRVPTLIIQGRQGYLGPTVGEQLAECMPAATLEILEDCGHYPMYERPAAFLKCLRTFLAGISDS